VEMTFPMSRELLLRSVVVHLITDVEWK